MAVTDRELLAARHGEAFLLLWDRLDEIAQTQHAMAHRLHRIELKEDAQMTDLSALTNEVQANGDVVDSAVTLLGSLAQQVRDLSTDPAALQALADQLDAQKSELAGAVAANTPAAPNQPPTDQPPTDQPPTDQPPVDENPPVDQGTPDAPAPADNGDQTPDGGTPTA